MQLRKFLMPAAVLISTSAVFSSAARIEKYSAEDARKVFRLIDEIQASQAGRPSTSALRSAEVSEKELNAYIAYRIENEKQEVMKELRLKLLRPGWVEGKMTADLKGRKGSLFFLPSKVDFFFAGNFLVEKERAKLELRELFLNGQKVPAKILDLVIRVIAKFSGSEAGSVNDWHELPYGIKNMEVRPGKLVVFY